MYMFAEYSREWKLSQGENYFLIYEKMLASK